LESARSKRNNVKTKQRGKLKVLGFGIIIGICYCYSYENVSYK